ncbi:LamG-like jellyroll fold domain-containing protein [Microbacterium sp. NPDC019599]|uniref:LamG-like jellyroll fold domain-containing protein n=1 Tax=Microbacterium sp. NPDC019599 TaxID=3154690 RepID=UPI0033E52B63
MAGPAPYARAAVSPRLPGEQGRQNNLVTRYGGTVFDHIRVSIAGDQARLFVPQGIVPGASGVPVLWLYHASGGSHDALISGFRDIGERAVDLGMIAICQNLGGTLYTSDAARTHQMNGWSYLSGIYGIDRNILRATSHGGALATEVLVSALMPSVVGAYVVNGVYDVVDLFRHGTPSQQEAVGQAYGYDMELMAARNPARHPGAAWIGRRIRVVYSQPDSSDAAVPPPAHAKALLATAGPYATEASARTHAAGHTTPSFADPDAQATFTRWMDQASRSEQPTAPRLVAQWDFAESAAPFASTVSGVAALAQGPGSAARPVATSFGAGVQFDGVKDHLRIARDQLGPLNIGATTGAVTIAAWVCSTDANSAMIAGCWQESTSGGDRAYALFNDLPTYGGDDRVCMNVSKTGGATAGYPSSRDYAADPRRISRGSWQLHVGTYDGAHAIAYLNGTAQPYPSYTDSAGATYSKNPYAFTAGINPAPSDFVVGASLRNGAPLNLHAGVIARLRVWNGALTAANVLALYEAEKSALN